MPETLCTDPEHIAISKSRGINIDWKDAHHSTYNLTWLRDHCPCATCTGAHGTTPRPKTSDQPDNPFKMYTRKLKMDAIESIGNYAIRIQWSDGHGSGIYSFEHLRKICPCETCRAQQHP